MKGRGALHMLGCIGREVGDQFVVDGQIGRQHKKVVDAVGRVRLSDKRTYQAGFAHTSGQGKVKGGEFALEVCHRDKLALDGRKQGGRIGIFVRWRDLDDAMEDFQ
jgi:hypothetical protein